MNNKEFVKEIINTVSDEYIDTYQQIYSSTLIDNKIKKDPYWFDALTFYQSLSQKDKETLFKIIKQTTIDTTSTILGIIDGPVSLNQISGDFTLTYTENEKTVILNGDLQDEFLTQITERNRSQWYISNYNKGNIVMGLKQKIIYKNSKNEKIKLILEPWAEEYNIESNSEVEIIVEGDIEKGYLMIESEIDRVVIYGWQGSLIQVFKNGKLID